MGLRFRKSISLCKGVRLNVGKTGVSISAGIPGFRKTIHSSGRVTTTAGIPGSGLYYVDTDHIGKKKKQQATQQEYATRTMVQQPVSVLPETLTKRSRTSIDSLTSIHNESANSNQIAAAQTASRSAYIAPTGSLLEPVEQITPVVDEPAYQPSFRELFENCDLPINWIDVLANRKPVDERYDTDTWDYLHSKAIAVFEGNVEVMLQIIDEVSPFDDLSSYAEDFTVEMEEPSEIEIEFAVTKNVAPRDELQDAVCSIVIRTARDAFALLPVNHVVVHTMLDGDTIISAKLDRKTFASLEFEGKDPSDLLEAFDVNMKYSSLLGFRKVDRLYK